MTSQTWGSEANPETAISNRPRRPPGVGNATSPSWATAGRSTTASAQSIHETAPVLPPVARNETASPLPSVVAPSRKVSSARLPRTLPDGITGGEAVSRVWPSFDIVNVTGWPDVAATRARYVTGAPAPAPAGDACKTVNALPFGETSGPSQSRPEPPPSRSIIVTSSSKKRRSSMVASASASGQPGNAAAWTRRGEGAPAGAAVRMK